MCCWLVLIAVGAVLLDPAPVTLLEVTDNSVHTDEATAGDALWTMEEDATDPSTPYCVINATLESGPGSPCQNSSDCASPLVCLASQSCGCPERMPVLLQKQASFSCGIPRRLNEPCLSHAECSHGNEHARCLGSVCQCPPSFRRTEETSLCLPASQPVGWPLQHTASFLAALLSLAFAILGFIGYRRLQKTRTGKNVQAYVAWSRRTESSGVPYERFSKSVESLPTKSKYLGTAFSLSWLRKMSFRDAESQSFVQTGYAAPQMISDNWYTVGSQEALQRRSASTANYTEPVSTWNYSGNLLHRASGVIRDTPSRNVIFSTGVDALNSETLKFSVLGASPSQALTVKTESGDKPTPKRRTKISTLSTYTLKPCRRTGNVGVDSYSGSSAVDTLTAGTTAGHRLRTGLLSVPEEVVENDANHFAGTPVTQKRPCDLDKFTESELKGGPPKKFKSERLRTSSPKRLRRALSDTRDPLAVIADDHAADCTVSETCSQTTCVVSSGTNAASSGYCFEWPVESYVTLYDDHKQEGLIRWPLSTASQPTGTFGGAVWKGPGHSPRTFRTFALHDGRRPSSIKPRMTAPVKVSLMGLTPLLPQPGWNRLPRTVDGAHRQRRRALRRSTVPSGPQSAVTRTSAPMAPTLTSATRRARSTNEPPGSRVLSHTMFSMGHPCRSAPQEIRATRLTHLDSGSQTLDTGFVGRIARSGSFRSFSSTASDASNLPLSASAILLSSRPGTSEPSGFVQ